MIHCPTFNFFTDLPHIDPIHIKLCSAVEPLSPFSVFFSPYGSEDCKVGEINSLTNFSNPILMVHKLWSLSKFDVNLNLNLPKAVGSQD